MNDLGLYRGLGSKLIEQGKIFLNKATPVTRVEFTRAQIMSIVMDATGLPVTAIELNDEKYFTTDIDTWKMLIGDDWINQHPYISDSFDCDNYSGSFTSAMADIYNLNTAGRFTCEIRNPITKKHYGYHRAVLLVDNHLDCWLLESQTDKMVKLEKGKFPVIDAWEYVVSFISLN